MKKIIVFSLLLVLLVTGCDKKNKDEGVVLGAEEAKTKATEFINKNFVQAGQPEATIDKVEEEFGMYKLAVNIGGQTITSYMTKDGKKVFPQVIDVEETEKTNTDSTEKSDQAQEATLADLPKTAKPKVELFVMSHCPYGTQIEKGILPVVKALGDKIDFKLKFCDYAMHGKKELDEQLTQYCIQKNEADKLVSYLECFLADETKSAECVKSTKINEAKLKTCISETDKANKVTEMFNDKSTWKSGQFPVFNVDAEDNTKYDIGGSPNLVINEKKISSARDASSLLKTICAGFENAPDSCNQELSAESPAPGFGFESAGSGGSTDAGCGE